MAIIKPIPTPFGVPAEYHRLTRVEVASDDRSVAVHVAVYANEEARRAGAQPLRVDQVRLPLGQFILDPREPFYRLLTDWPLSFLHGGEPDVDVEGDSVLPLHPYVPPPLPPSPPAQSGGPESVPGYAPGPLAEPTT